MIYMLICVCRCRCICICRCRCKCIYVYVYVHVCVCILKTHTYVMYVDMYVCMYVYMYVVCIDVHVYTYTLRYMCFLSVCIYACAHARLILSIGSFMASLSSDTPWGLMWAVGTRFRPNDTCMAHDRGTCFRFSYRARISSEAFGFRIWFPHCLEIL